MSLVKTRQHSGITWTRLLDNVEVCNVLSEVWVNRLCILDDGGGGDDDDVDAHHQQCQRYTNFTQEVLISAICTWHSDVTCEQFSNGQSSLNFFRVSSADVSMYSHLSVDVNQLPLAFCEAIFNEDLLNKRLFERCVHTCVPMQKCNHQVFSFYRQEITLPRALLLRCTLIKILEHCYQQRRRQACVETAIPTWNRIQMHLHQIVDNLDHNAPLRKEINAIITAVVQTITPPLLQSNNKQHIPLLIKKTQVIE